MKLVKEHMNEAIKHLSPKSENEIIDNFFESGGDIWDFYNENNNKIMYDLEEIHKVNITEKNKEKIRSKMKELFDDSLEYIFSMF